MGGSRLAYLWAGRGLGDGLGDNLFYDLAVHIGESEIAALEPVREFLVVDAEEVEHGRVHVVDVDDVLDRVVAEVVRRAVRDAALNAATGHPDGKSLDVMVASA